MVAWGVVLTLLGLWLIVRTARGGLVEKIMGA
jgi:hypothetical protein